MKKYLKIILTLLILAALAAILFTKFYKVEEPITFEEALPFYEDLACVKINGKYGYINKTGEVVLDPIYDTSNFFFDKITIQSKDNLYGCIDNTGKEIIPFQYQDLTLSTKEIFTAKKNGKYGLINSNNEVVVDFISVQPISYSEYSDKHRVAIFTNEMNKCGLIDLVTGYKLEPIYDEIYAWGNKENTASIRLGMKYGFINLDTQTLIEPIFDNGLYFTEGLAVASVNFKSGFMDVNGNYIVEQIYEDASPFTEGLAFVKIDGKYGCINTKGEMVIEPTFVFGSTFTNGVAQVILNDNYETAYINTKGEVVDLEAYSKGFATYLSQYYPEDAPFIPSYYMSEENSQKAMGIDRNGKILFKTIYDQIFNVEHNMATVMLNDKIGCITAKGIEILPPIYSDIQIVDENHLIINENGKYGLIDTLRNEILPLKYQDIVRISSKLVLVKAEGKWGSYNLETKTFKENLYDKIYNPEEMYYFDSPVPVQKGDRWFYLDESGERLF